MQHGQPMTAAREACGRWFLANRSVEADPNDPAALVARAASFLAMDRPWEATNDLDRALRMQTRLACGEVATSSDQDDATRRRWRHDGEEARIRLLRGHAHASCLRYDRAVADFAESDAILTRLEGSGAPRSQATPAHAKAGLGVAYCNMRDWQRSVDAGERALGHLPLDDVARRHVARAVETARQHLTLTSGGGGGLRRSGAAPPPQLPPPLPRDDAGDNGGAAPAPAPAAAPAPAPASAPTPAPSASSYRGRMSPGGESPGRIPAGDVAEAAMWAAGADSDGELTSLDATAAAVLSSTRPDVDYPGPDGAWSCPKCEFAHATPVDIARSLSDPGAATYTQTCMWCGERNPADLTLALNDEALGDPKPGIAALVSALVPA